ncbi:hypothetical protein B0H21DRAFT_731564 [Amylocystis lapponica]|nr:hypothetical protein B0H21DRAFT_731564 [Amylocystis lapponica]
MHARGLRIGLPYALPRTPSPDIGRMTQLVMNSLALPAVTSCCGRLALAKIPPTRLSAVQLPGHFASCCVANLGTASTPALAGTGTFQETIQYLPGRPLPLAIHQDLRAPSRRQTLCPQHQPHLWETKMKEAFHTFLFGHLHDLPFRFSSQHLRLGPYLLSCVFLKPIEYPWIRTPLTPLVGQRRVHWYPLGVLRQQVADHVRLPHVGLDLSSLHICRKNGTRLSRRGLAICDNESGEMMSGEKEREEWLGFGQPGRLFSFSRAFVQSSLG